MRKVFVTLALCAASLLHAQERTLSWKALDVTAKLENDGTLRVSERHRMLFNGAWNGGERVFRVEPGQELVLRGMGRVDEDGDIHEMTEARGSGIALHEYRFDGRTLRWRARETDDPPFRNEERGYVIEYLLRNVIAPSADGFALDHEMALLDRPGPIESFSAQLELDSAWQAPPDFEPRFERANLPPGEGARLTVQLKRIGAEQPLYVAPLAPLVPAEVMPVPREVRAPRPAVTLPAPAPPASVLAKLIGCGAFALAALMMTIAFLRREESLGRFEPPPHVTPEWLEENLLVHRAEVVGAAWDGATGPGEVAALIAIMTAEGKMENVAGAPKLRLLVPRESLSDYERGFVDALFINGNEIDPETLRRHYREVGFHPSTTIAAPLNAAAYKLVGSAPRVSWAFGCLAFVLAGFLFPGMAIAFAVTLAPAGWYRTKLLGRGMAWAIPVPLLFSALVHALTDISAGWLIANLIAGAALLGLALRLASWRESAFELRNLVNFLAARAFLLQRIVERDAEVDPRWIPYMLAFGLVPDDRWSVAAAPAVVAREPMRFDHDRRRDEPSVGVRADGDGDDAPASPPPTRSFQPGGGGFGGAGATGSWASIQAFASAVAATPTYTPSVSTGSSRPSRSSGSGWSWSSSGGSSSSSSRSSSSSSSRSSSSSSRSSSGGSRSGGGGGGGW